MARPSHTPRQLGQQLSSSNSRRSHLSTEFPKLQVLALVNQHLVQPEQNISVPTLIQFQVQALGHVTTKQIRPDLLSSDAHCQRTNDLCGRTLCNHPNQECVVVATVRSQHLTLGFRLQTLRLHSLFGVRTCSPNRYIGLPWPQVLSSLDQFRRPMLIGCRCSQVQQSPSREFRSDH